MKNKARGLESNYWNFMELLEHLGNQRSNFDHPPPSRRATRRAQEVICWANVAASAKSSGQAADAHISRTSLDLWEVEHLVYGAKL